MGNSILECFHFGLHKACIRMDGERGRGEKSQAAISAEGAGQGSKQVPLSLNTLLVYEWVVAHPSDKHCNYILGSQHYSYLFPIGKALSGLPIRVLEQIREFREV